MFEKFADHWPNTYSPHTFTPKFRRLFLIMEQPIGAKVHFIRDN